MKKHILIVLFFIAALTAKAQVPYESFSDDGITLEFSKIENLDFRVFFMYNLQHDDQFVLVPNDSYGSYVITSTNDDTYLAERFDTYYNDKLVDFSLLSKEEIMDLMPMWKNAINGADMTSILMDWTLRQTRVDNEYCLQAEPFCTTDNYTFIAANTEIEGEDGPYYCCVSHSYNPSWYYMRIGVGGYFTIHMEGHDPQNYSTERDIDFCLWGPFTDYRAACDSLTASMVVDCSYSASYEEDVMFNNPTPMGSSCVHHMHEPIVGEFYILLITNYSRQPCSINFSKVEGSGPGETDCGILPPLVNNDGPFCTGETIHLSANGQSGASYRWVGPNGFNSTLQNPTLENATVNMSGDYTCTITLGNETSHATTEVIVNAMPDPTATAQPGTVIYGGTSQLGATPGAEGSFSYHWEPADMVTNANAQNPNTVVLTSTQIYTVTVSNTEGDCVATAEVTVRVEGSGLTATATADEYVICEGSSTTLHARPLDGTGNYTYSWEPAELLSSTTVQNPVATPPLGTTTFTCTVGDGMATQVAEVTILVNPNRVEERYVSICEHGSYPFFDQGNLSTPGIYEAHIPTSLGCDSLIRLHLSVDPAPETSFTVEDDENCDSYYWDPMGLSFEGDQTLEFTHSGSYTRTYRTISDCDSIVTMNVEFEYTPNPTEILPKDTITSHWVVPATEFQVNTYSFHLYERNPNCHWDSIAWQCIDQYGNDVWPIESYVDQVNYPREMYFCEVYVTDRIEGTVTLRAIAYNRCQPVGVIRDFWMVCSFYGNDEHVSTAADFSVVPNPNNGQMRLAFEGLSGKISVKVYDMSGSLIDSFESYNENSVMDYTMRRNTPGIYYFVATAKEGTIAKKVVVTH